MFGTRLLAASQHVTEGVNDLWSPHHYASWHCSVGTHTLILNNIFHHFNCPFYAQSASHNVDELCKWCHNEVAIASTCTETFSGSNIIASVFSFTAGAFNYTPPENYGNITMHEYHPNRQIHTVNEISACVMSCAPFCTLSNYAGIMCTSILLCKQDPIDSLLFSQLGPKHVLIRAHF